MRKINIPTSALNVAASKKAGNGEPEITNMMMDARYLRQSSSLIQEALQKGFDVLQLENGDIVTTGTKTIVHQYSWDPEKGKLIKAKHDAAKKRKAAAEEELSSIEG